MNFRNYKYLNAGSYVLSGIAKLPRSIYKMISNRPASLIKFFLLFFYLVYLPGSALYAQNRQHKIDRLKTVLARTVNESQKLEIVFQLGETLWFSRQIPEAIKYLQQTISAGEALKDYRHNCNAHLLLGHARMRMEEFTPALASFKEALNCSQKNNQPEHIPKVHEGYAHLYNLLGDNAKAISFGLLAAQGYEASNIENINEQSVFAWLDVARIFEQQQQYDKALEYYNKALQKTAKKEWLAKGPMLGVANVYLAQDKLADAKKMYRHVVAIDRKGRGTEPTMDGLNGLGQIALREKDNPAAISFFRAALDTALNRNFLIAADGFAANLGHAFLLNNQPDSASEFLQSALNAALKNGDVRVQKEAYSHLALLETKRGNLAEAITYRQQLQTLSDSLYNVDRVKAVNNIEILYETEKKEKAILTLRADNANKEVAIVKRNRFLLVAGIAMVALLLMMSLYSRNVKHKQHLAKNEKRLQEEQIKFLKEQQQVVSLQSMVNGQETERTRIAKDLHDGLGGLFSTIKMYFSTLQHEQENLKTNSLFSKSYELIDTASEEVRRIAHNMMPEVLMKLGLVHALQDMCNNISAGKLLQVKLQSYGMSNRMNKSTEIMLYRIVQELLNNIIKHAHASEAIVQFNREGESLHVTVEDNGQGFNLQEADDKKHAGLDTIRSRVNYLNGNISIDSQKQIGTTVTMEFLINEGI